MIEIGRAGDLQEVWKVAGYFKNAAGVTRQRQSRLRRWPCNQVQSRLASECAQENVGKDVEERRISDELGAAKVLKVAPRTGDVGDVIVIGDRAQKGVELQV